MTETTTLLSPATQLDSTLGLPIQKSMDIYLANPRGFCAGVHRAIEIVERVLELFGAPIYVRHEVVHNRFVVESLRARGAVFVDEVDQVPPGATIIFSAHGIAQQVRTAADARQLRVFDATCPLVTKVHLEVARHCRDGYEVVLIGHRGHPEVEGTMGQCPDGSRIHLVQEVADVPNIPVSDPDHLAYVTQTTLSVDDTQEIISALKNRFPRIEGPRKNDICYATQNRQDAVKDLARHCELLLVVGSTNSSNSNRLRELAEKQGTPAYLIDGAEEIQREWLANVTTAGVTAGASAPEILVEQVIARLKEWGAVAVVERSGIREQVVFALPRELVSSSSATKQP
jgi:4-hydroxy-3-methylbut-2-en-1-yl diphosphate reductase